EKRLAVCSSAGATVREMAPPEQTSLRLWTGENSELIPAMEALAKSLEERALAGKVGDELRRLVVIDEHGANRVLVDSLPCDMIFGIVEDTIFQIDPPCPPNPATNAADDIRSPESPEREAELSE